MYTVCQLPVTIYQIPRTRRNFYLPEDGQGVWPKHVGISYDKYEALWNQLAVNFVLYCEVRTSRSDTSYEVEEKETIDDN